MKRLTDVTFWEENWWKLGRPRRLRLYRDLDFETIRLLRDAGGVARPWVIELGAGGSRALPYLRRKFGYRIFGSDFSLAGCLLLRANLALQGVDGIVICEDLFQSSLPPDAFDLVYSAGLVEHFDDTCGVLAEHLRVVKPGGRLVVIVPNFQGLQGKICRRLAPSLWSRHQVFGPDELARLFEGLGLRKTRSGYLGSFFLHIGRGTGWSVVEGWPLWRQWLIHWPLRLVNGLISLLFRLCPLRPHTRALSPAFFAAGTKPTL